MKKSTIWMLVLVMLFAFAGLLSLQVQYVFSLLKTRSEQFNETVKKSLTQIARNLEIDESRRFLEEDIRHGTAPEFTYSTPGTLRGLGEISTQEQISVQIDDQSISYQIQLEKFSRPPFNPLGANKRTSGNSIESTSKDLLEDYKNRYRYNQALLHEVIVNMLATSNLTPIEERIDFKKLNIYLKTEFKNNGLELPFVFSVINKDEKVVYQSGALQRQPKASDVLTTVLFPNDPPSQLNHLKVYFPGKSSYIFGSIVTFLIPSVIFSLLLLVTFTFTIYIVFRQKKLSEMKNDFINNMTHELKTPVSTISLAAQMLKDSDITKSPDVFRHISGVINDETKRLGFLVEKVLQISLFERQKAALKLKEIDANDLLANIANTFVLKVEKYGGSMDIDLQAIDSTIYADEMHITNVMFNLMDNAVKYRRPEVPLELMARTWNENGKLMISIEDNGIGIKKEYQKKVFDRFFRVPTGNVHDVKGFGLGLAYVRKIMEDHNGSIRAESGNNNVGTKFIITLPLIKS